MSSFPFITLFSITLILGSLISLRGNHWIFIWIGLELNLLSFIPLLTFSNLNQEREAAIKYFLAQALGSGLILLRALSFSIKDQIIIDERVLKLFLFTGLLIKLGLPPCHFWFPSVISIISWPICIILATWQKLIPILLITYIMTPSLSYLFILAISFGALIGGIGGLNQTQLRPLLAYSSMGHISWMIAASLTSYSSGILYLVTYIIITLPLISIFWSNSSSLSISINNINHSPKIFFFSLFLLVLSLGGIPPLLGFFPKWLVLEGTSSLSPFLCLIILLGSAFNLFYYLNLLFISILKIPSNLLKPSINSSRFHLISLSFLSSLTLGLGPLLFLLIYAMTFLHKS